MSDYKQLFRDKKITVMGLGLLGRGVAVTKFLAEAGADLLVTDLKDKKELKPSLDKLKKYKNIEYVLGRHRLGDFEHRDMIIKAAGVPIGSKYIERAKENNIPVEMDASLFAKIVKGRTEAEAPDVTLIGVTGTRGKSTVTHLIHHMLEVDRKEKKQRSQFTHLAGNVRDTATLPLLDKIRDDDRVVIELDSWQLQGFGDAEISPDLSVFTNFLPDHLNYYGNMRSYFMDKAHIFRYQVDGNYIVVGQSAYEAIQKYYQGEIHGTMALARENRVPYDWELWAPGIHMRQNVALAMQVGEIMDLESDVIRRAAESFRGVEGRMEYVKLVRGAEVYNDNNATSPEATIAALKSFPERNVVLITGGTDKNLDYSKLTDQINEKVKRLILIPGTATDKIRKNLRISSSEHDSLEEAFEQAVDAASSGDVILFSPASSSFGLFTNEYERNDQFLDIARSF
ncbi:MAG: UDP-N-acetylmuramoyl-L-alanine--D-glutamate ligase [Candidatus Paceibacterota bacterium]